MIIKWMGGVGSKPSEGGKRGILKFGCLCMCDGAVDDDDKDSRRHENKVDGWVGSNL